MKIDSRAFWVWLQRALGAGSGKPRRILSVFPGPREFYEAGRREWTMLGIFTQKELFAMESFSPEEAQETVRRSEELGHRVVTQESAEYPQCLRNIHNPPCALYVRGSLPDFDALPSVAVVGTRGATFSGRKIAFGLSCQLAGAGAVVVSGGARGIDTAAHKGALQAGGKTVCVLGCGLDFPYLMENAGLRDSIALCGAVISEYPLGTPGSKRAFPIRNRIISGLCDGTLVVEAAAKSGSLITADLALEQGRDVFAVPCGLDNPVSRGVNNLIKTGAVPVSSGYEILEQYRSRYPGKIRFEKERNLSGLLRGAPASAGQRKPPAPSRRAEPKGERAPCGAEFSADARAVCAQIGPEPVPFSVLGQKTGLDAARLLSALTELELGEKIESLGGRRYRLPQ